MAEELPGLTSKVTIDPSGVDKGLDATISKIHKFSGDADRSFNAFTKRVNAEFSKLSGETATERLRVIEQAFTKAGGAANIAAPQLERLRKQVAALAAEGGKVPSALAGLEQQTSKLQSLGDTLLRGGGISGALSALGPAGIAAAAGITAFGGAVTGLGNALAEATKAAVAYGGRIADLAAKNQMGVETFQALSQGLGLTGVSMEELQKATTEMQKELIKSPETFRQLGLDVGRLRSMDPADAFLKTAKAVAAIEEPAARTAAAFQVFGKSGAAVAGAVSQLGDAAGRAHELGNVMSKEVIEALDRTGDAAQTLMTTWEHLWLNIGAAVATTPGVAESIDAIAEAVGAVSNAIKENEPLIQALTKDVLPAIAGAAKLVSNGIVTLIGVLDDLAAKWQQLPPVMRTFMGGGTGGILEALKGVSGVSPRAAESNIIKIPEAVLVGPGVGKKPPKPPRGPTAAEKAAAAAKKAAEELERRVGPAADKAQKEMDELAKSVVATGGAFDRSKASYETITRNLQALEKAGAQVPKVLKDVQVAASLPAQKDLGILGQAVPGIAQTGLKVPELEGIEGNTVDLLKEAKEEIEGADEVTIDWSQTLADVAHLFEILGINADSAMGKVLGSVTGAEAAFKGIQGALGKGLKGFLTGGGVTGIVAAAGVVANLVSAFKKPEHEKVMEGVGRDYGVKISEGLGKQIAEDSKALGDRTAAILKNLGGIIGEAGGVKAFGTDKAIAKTRDLFSALERGQLTAAEVGKTFDEVFAQILPEAVDKGTGLVSADFKDLIALSQRFGVESKGVTDFLNQQAQAAGSNLAKAISAGVATEAGAAGFGASIAAQLEEMVDRGATRGEALQALMPSIQALREELERTGFAGGAAFDLISAQAGILTDEVTGPLAGKIDAIGQSLVALENQGLLTADIFTGLTTEVGATAAALAEQGVSGPAALAVMQPALQQIFELQQQYGFAVDETTQKLLDEAEASGVVGDAHKSAQDRMVDGLERVGDVLESIARKLGADLPAAAQRGAKGIEDAFGGISLPSPELDFRFRAPDLPDYGQQIEGFATGGVRDFGDATMVELHGREAVLPARGGGIVDELAASIRDGMGDAGGGAGAGVTVNNQNVFEVSPLGIRENAEQFFAEIEARQAAAVRTGTSELLRALQDRGVV